MSGLILYIVSAYSADLGLNTVVIDAGHGGNDPGAVSYDRKTYEKNLTLDIAQKLAAKIRRECPGVNVILSRSDDKFVALEDRASCANRKNANLFISIHINSTRSSSPNGYSVHILGQSSNKNRDLFEYNMDVCKRENSVILLENDYDTKYQGFDPSDPESFIFMQLMQNAYLEQSLEFAQIVSEKLSAGPIKANRGIWQNPFLVLWRTSMPSVLVELGFISNTSDLSVLRDNSKRDQIADCLLDAFKDYKKLYDASVDISGGNNTQSLPAPDSEKTKETHPASSKPELGKVPEQTPSPSKPAPEKKKDELFGWQIMAGKARIPSGDKCFLGYNPEIIEVGGLFKYVIGVSDSPEKSYKESAKIKSKYPTAFFVRISNGIFPYNYVPEKHN